MDMSKIVWLVVIVAIVGGGWLLTGSGMDKMYENATSSMPGNDPEKDKVDEATLSKYAQYNLTLFRYEKAKQFYTAALERYGTNGANYWWNVYQLARVEEKLENYPDTIELLYLLWVNDGDQFDERVPNRDTLQRRITTLCEVNDIPVTNYSFRQ